ncbi:MAG: Ig-like domain-containing protein [Candidatus Micrarchaeaceae archaeon]
MLIAALIGASSGIYALHMVGASYTIVKSTVIFIAGVFSLVLAYGLWSGAKWGWWLGIIVSIVLIFTIMLLEFVSFFAGMIILYYLMGRRTRTYFNLMHAQSAMDYMMTYGWAILIIAIVIVFLFVYIGVPYNVVPTSCNFVSGIKCSAVTISSANNGKSTNINLLVINSIGGAMLNPTIHSRINGANSTEFGCFPDFVLPGGTIVCLLTLPLKSSNGEFISGALYLNATVCALTSATSVSTCGTKINNIYVGNFSGDVEQSSKATTVAFFFNAANYTQLVGHSDQLEAIIELSGSPLPGATVNFTISNSIYSLAPRTALTGSSGTALTAVSGRVPGSVVVTAYYAGVSNSLTIDFVNKVTTSTTTTTTTSSSTTTTTIQNVPSLILSMSPSNVATTDWTMCIAYNAIGSDCNYYEDDCIGKNHGGAFNVLQVSDTATVCDVEVDTSWPYFSGNYGFTEFTPSNTGHSFPGCGSSNCYSLDIPITGPYYINANFQQEQTSNNMVPITLSMNPADAANYWGLCITYEVPGFQSDQPDECIGNTDRWNNWYYRSRRQIVSTNTIYVPYGSTLDYVCTEQGNSMVDYGFTGWSGNFAWDSDCESGSDITINAPYTIQANFNVIDTNVPTVPITLSISPASVASISGMTLCIDYKYPGVSSYEPPECVGNGDGFSGSTNTINVPVNTVIGGSQGYVCTTPQGDGWGFTGWTGNYQVGGDCDYGYLDITVNAPYTIQADYSQIPTYSNTVNIILSQSPSATATYWQSCVYYELPGFEFAEESCVGNAQGFSGSYNAIAVPTGTMLEELCTGTIGGDSGGYTFIGWTGNIVGSNECYFPWVQIEGTYTLQADFQGSASTTSTTTSSSTSTSTSTSSTSSTSTTISYTLTMGCAGPVNQNCGITPQAGIEYSYPTGSAVSISAPQDAASTSACSGGQASFVDWTGAGGGYTGTELSNSFIMTSDVTETATYQCYG